MHVYTMTIYNLRTTVNVQVSRYFIPLTGVPLNLQMHRYFIPLKGVPLNLQDGPKNSGALVGRHHSWYSDCFSTFQWAPATTFCICSDLFVYSVLIKEIILNV